MWIAKTTVMLKGNKTQDLGQALKNNHIPMPRTRQLHAWLLLAVVKKDKDTKLTVRALRWASWQLPSHCEWYQIRDQIRVTQWGWEVGRDRRRASQPFLCIWILEAENGLTFFFRSVVDYAGHSFNRCLSSLADPGLVTENFGLWSFIRFLSSIMYPKKLRGRL